MAESGDMVHVLPAPQDLPEFVIKTTKRKLVPLYIEKKQTNKKKKRKHIYIFITHSGSCARRQRTAPAIILARVNLVNAK